MAKLPYLNLKIGGNKMSENCNDNGAGHVI